MADDQLANQRRLNDFLERYADGAESRGLPELAEAVRRQSIPMLPFLRPRPTPTHHRGSHGN